MGVDIENSPREGDLSVENRLHSLKRFNTIMGAVHLVQGVIMIFLATSVIQKIAEFQPTIVQYYLTFNPVTKSLEPASRELFTLPFGILVASLTRSDASLMITFRTHPEARLK